MGAVQPLLGRNPSPALLALQGRNGRVDARGGDTTLCPGVGMTAASRGCREASGGMFNAQAFTPAIALAVAATMLFAAGPAKAETEVTLWTHWAAEKIKRDFVEDAIK